MKKAFTLLLFITSFLSFCQTTYQAGYFISNNGKKTDCLIKNIGWKNSPSQFVYKLSENTESTTETIDNVSFFSVSGYEFRRFTVNLDRSTNDVGRMSVTPDPEWETKTVFLKVLVKGKAALYHYEDGNLVRFFVSTDDNATAQQLVYKQFIRNTGIETNTKFRGQLYDIMKDKMPDANRYKNLKYDKDALVKLFLEYNGADSEDSEILAASQNKAVINFKITPGVNFASADAVRNDLPNAEMNFDTKPVFRIGAEIELLFPFNNNKWALFADPNYYQYKNTSTVANYTWTVDVKYIDIPAGIRHYMYLNSKSKLFLDAAYVLTFSTGSSTVSYSYISDSQTYSKSFKASANTYVSFGAGYSYDRYSIEARLNLNREILSNVDYVNSSLSSVGIILGYKIF